MKEDTRNRRIRILIVSNTPWDDSNSFGSSFSNIFGGNDRYDIANIYCSFGFPDTKVAKCFFQITYHSILKKVIGRIPSSGKKIEVSEKDEKKIATLSTPSELTFAKRRRWQILFWIQDLIWFTGAWKSHELDQFIDGFKPDLIFQPVYYVPHPNRIGVYASVRSGAPMVGYTSDDCYSLRQYSWSPLFWIDRLIKRRLFKKVVDRCKTLYVITETQRLEYDKYFGIGKCKILFKGGDFSGNEPQLTEHNPLRFLYTGNLGTGRAETLASIAKAIHSWNMNGAIKATLDIYSATQLTPSQLSSLNIGETSRFHGSVSSSEVARLQSDSDVLIHVETFDKRSRYKSRLSLSTKIVDYMHAAKPIVSVGWAETGGLEYLAQNNATLAITNPEKIHSEVIRIIEDKDLRQRLAHNAWQLGVKNHKCEYIRSGLYHDLSQVLNSV